MIGFVGSVFSPYYAFARRRGPADPANFCAINVALYGKSGHRWAMTERGRRSLRRDANSLEVGPSAMSWEGGELVIRVSEVTVPWPSRLAGTIRIRPETVVAEPVMLAGDGAHHWRPVAPRATVEVDFDRPALRWQGTGYHDMNWGDGPLEDAFRFWTWARAETPGGCRVIYDADLRDGSRKAFRLDIDRHGGTVLAPLPARQLLPGGLWGMNRHMAVEGAPQLVATLEDSPFYMRSLVQTDVDGLPVTAMHESLSLDRFRKPVVQMMLPFRMPRRS